MFLNICLFCLRYSETLTEEIDFKHFLFINIRSSRSEVLCKKGVLRNFGKFTGKYLCQNLFFNKVVGRLELY